MKFKVTKRLDQMPLFKNRKTSVRKVDMIEFFDMSVWTGARILQRLNQKNLIILSSEVLSETSKILKALSPIIFSVIVLFFSFDHITFKNANEQKNLLTV